MKAKEDITPLRGIKDWAAEDRPREKLLAKGSASLSDAELIAILLGTGSASMSAVDLAKVILQRASNNLDDLARLSVSDLMKIKGVGQAKAISIISALELGRRRREGDVPQRPAITTSAEAYQLVQQDLIDLPHEAFWVILLNRANRFIRKMQISRGGVHGTVADPKLIFKAALDELASGIIVVHNHPSGNLTPSTADTDLTKKLNEGARLLEIRLIDHLIIAGKKYFSFADEGRL
jgi:DNA repair protein RadC